MSDIDICPPLYPINIWNLLQRHPWPGPKPPNDGWPILEEVLVNLNLYVMSYAVADAKVATELREVCGNLLKRSVENLTKVQ
jgi:hypothetical protein